MCCICGLCVYAFKFMWVCICVCACAHQSLNWSTSPPLPDKKSLFGNIQLRFLQMWRGHWWVPSVGERVGGVETVMKEAKEWVWGERGGDALQGGLVKAPESALGRMMDDEETTEKGKKTGRQFGLLLIFHFHLFSTHVTAAQTQRHWTWG